MQFSDFTVHDISRFPVVRCTSERIYPGYGCQWRSELETLINRNEPFFMVYEEGEFVEDPSDTRTRARWLKENKSCLSRVCKGIVSVESNESRRCEMANQCQGLTKAFGIPRFVAKDSAEAQKLCLATL